MFKWTKGPFTLRPIHWIGDPTWTDLKLIQVWESVHTRLDRSQTRLDRSQFAFERSHIQIAFDLGVILTSEL